MPSSVEQIRRDRSLPYASYEGGVFGRKQPGPGLGSAAMGGVGLLCLEDSFAQDMSMGVG